MKSASKSAGSSRYERVAWKSNVPSKAPHFCVGYFSSLLSRPNFLFRLQMRTLTINMFRDHVQNPTPFTSIEARKLLSLTA